jgi:hypothetical protein
MVGDLPDSDVPDPPGRHPVRPTPGAAAAERAAAPPGPVAAAERGTVAASGQPADPAAVPAGEHDAAPGDERPHAGARAASGSWTATPIRIRRRAAGIYGTIITAAIIEAVGPSRPTLPLGIAVLVTLVVYWLAEEYAEVLGQQTETGRLPRWHEVSHRLAARWSMVSASFIPLIVLTVVRLAGASPAVAANVALAAAVLLLMAYVLAAGRAAELRAWQQVTVTGIAAVAGLTMIVLKNLVLLHLH